MIAFDLNYMITVLPILIKALKVTLSIALISLVISLILSLVLALITYNKIKILNIVCKVYISFFRGTPALAQLFLLYFGIFQIIPIFKSIDAYTAIIIALSLNSSAYMAETMRGAIESVDKRQMEACLSIGMTNMQAMRRVILPQAARVAIPSLSNSFVDLIKGSSLAFTIGVPEIMATANFEGAATYKFFEVFVAVVIIYWIITIVFGFLQKKLEIKLSKAY